MVATVGSISIDLSTNTAKFTQGFKASASTVDRESKRMANSVNGFAKASRAASGVMSGFVGGIVAGGALAAIGSLTGALGKARQSLSDFEEIGNRAKATGLGTDTFQAISHGASLADVEQESLNKSLEIFAKNVGLAKNGAGNLYSSMIKLNPVLLQQILNAKDQETRLKLVADAMSKMTDATDKAALATTVFGRGGAEMVRVLDKGSASIEKMKRDAKDLGIIIPEELIARAGELDDKLTTLQKVIDVNISEALVKAAPLLVAGAEGMVKLAKGANDLSTALNNFTSNKSLKTFMDLLKAIGIEPKLTGPAKALKDMLDPDPAAALNAELYKTQRQMFLVGEEIKAAEAKLAEFLKHKDEPGGMFDVVQGRKDLAILHADMDALDRKARNLKVEIDTSSATAAINGLSERTIALAQQFRSAENASMKAMGEMGGYGRLPNVIGSNLGGGGGIDPETGEKIERAIEKETDATRQVAARTSDVYRGVGQLDTHTTDGFAGLQGGFRDIGTALRSLPTALRTSAANSGGFAYSGNNSSGSWAGKQLSFGGGGGGGAASDFYNAAFGGRANRVGGVEDASSITSAATPSNAINVSVVVKPVMEGTRLSGQSAAEIKQAASAGANAALRAFYGR